MRCHNDDSKQAWSSLIIQNFHTGRDDLKVHKHKNFFGSDFEFLNFYGKLCLITIFLKKKKFHCTNIKEASIIPRILSIRGKRFFLQVRRKKFSQKTQI